MYFIRASSEDEWLLSPIAYFRIHLMFSVFYSAELLRKFWLMFPSWYYRTWSWVLQVLCWKWSSQSLTWRCPAYNPGSFYWGQVAWVLYCVLVLEITAERCWFYSCSDWDKPAMNLPIVFLPVCQTNDGKSHSGRPSKPWVSWTPRFSKATHKGSQSSSRSLLNKVPLKWSLSGWANF